MVLVMTTLKLDTPVLDMADLGPWEPHCGELKVLPPVGPPFKASDHFQGPFFPQGDMAREEMFVPTHFTLEPRRGILDARADTTRGHPWSRCTAWLGFQAGIHGLGLLPGPSCGIFLVHLCICHHLSIYTVYTYTDTYTDTYNRYLYLHL